MDYIFRYISTDGGSVYHGTCGLALLSPINFQYGAVDPQIFPVDGGSVFIGELEGTDPDLCPDIDENVNGRAFVAGMMFTPVSKPTPVFRDIL